MRTKWPVLVALAVWLGPSAVSAQARGAQARVIVSQPMVPMDGARLTAKVVEVTYPPGGASTQHRHPCAVIGYVVSGAVRMGIQTRPDSVYRRGETFYEQPNDLHRVSANASDIEPATFIAYFLCDRETPLTVPASDASPKGQR